MTTSVGSTVVGIGVVIVGSIDSGVVVIGTVVSVGEAGTVVAVVTGVAAGVITTVGSAVVGEETGTVVFSVERLVVTAVVAFTVAVSPVGFVVVTAVVEVRVIAGTGVAVEVIVVVVVDGSGVFRVETGAFVGVVGGLVAGSAAVPGAVDVFEAGTVAVGIVPAVVPTGVVDP